MMEKLNHKPEEESDDYSDELSETEDTTDSEDIYSESDFMKENNEEFETDLSRDIQNMMSDEKLEVQARLEEHTRPEEDLSEEEMTGFDEEYQGSESVETYGEFQEGEIAGTEEELSEDSVAVTEEQYREDEIAGTEENPVEDSTAGAEEEYTYNPSGFTTSEDHEYTGAEEDCEPAQEVVLDEEDLRLKQLGEKYELNPEEIFDNFLHVISVKKQIVKGLETILQDNKKAAFIIVTGAEGSGKTTLAKDMALLLSKAGRIQSSKVAKISAEKLNTVDIDSKKETLKSCCLVVENASKLKRTTIERILELTRQLKGDIAVVFEEDKKNMNKLFRECPSLMDLLRVRIHLPQYTQEDLRGFAIACLNQKDYRLNPDTEAVLESKLDQIARHSEPHTYLAQINDLMQSAMNSADVRTGKMLTDLAAQGRLKEVDLLEVLPEDFNI
jgi:ABC-type glutathione transport system ATPase component